MSNPVIEREQAAHKIIRGNIEDLFLVMDQVGMNDWERDFVTDLYHRPNTLFLSEKQKLKIADLVEKYDL